VTDSNCDHEDIGEPVTKKSKAWTWALELSLELFVELLRFYDWNYQYYYDGIEYYSGWIIK
jgi:hypothetical protein